MDITPTWEAAISIYIEVLRNPDASFNAVTSARMELIRLARMVDKMMAKEHWYNNDMNPANKLNALMERVCMLEDLYETAMKEDDRWTANRVLLELEEINNYLDSDENEHWYN